MKMILRIEIVIYLKVLLLRNLEVSVIHFFSGGMFHRLTVEKKIFIYGKTQRQRIR